MTETQLAECREGSGLPVKNYETSAMAKAISRRIGGDVDHPAGSRNCLHQPVTLVRHQGSMLPSVHSLGHHDV
jgi:hypothetical protein